MPHLQTIWDLPTRLFHWALVLAVITLYLTAKFSEPLGDFLVERGIATEVVVLHSWCGYFVFSLLLFRLCWAVFGSSSASFRSWFAAPGVVLNYLRAIKAGNKPVLPGHNPLGGYSAAAMLLLLFAQVGSGLFADDEVSFTGPLAAHVSAETVELLTHWHHLNFDLLQILIGLHLTAILIYHWRFSEQLLPAMIHGRKALAAQAELRFASNRRALGCYTLCVLLVFFIVS